MGVAAIPRPSLLLVVSDLSTTLSEDPHRREKYAYLREIAKRNLNVLAGSTH